ncbi:hypothetical protein THIOKS1360002 [Thiocapsa sp. KS1]|nr:hypothetical protein THIOKS1360002 [Thiocapsa sp. KS1]
MEEDDCKSSIPGERRFTPLDGVASGRTDAQCTIDVSMRIQTYLGLFQVVRACSVGMLISGNSLRLGESKLTLSGRQSSNLRAVLKQIRIRLEQLPCWWTALRLSTLR